jgi:hypothetical protein
LQIVLSLMVGAVAKYNLVAGFAIIGIAYALEFACSSWPISARTPAAGLVDSAE